MSVLPNRSARVRSLGLALAMGLVAALVPACTAPAPATGPPACSVPATGTDPYGLLVRLGDHAVELTWHQPSGTPVASFDVQLLGADGSWSTLQTVTSTSASVSGLVDRSSNVFRVRPTPPLGGAKSLNVRICYVEPVLPVIRIDTTGGQPIADKDTYLPATMTLDPNGSAFAAFSGTTEIKGHGNQTWTKPKKPYHLKLTSSVDLMGMGASKHWILLANYMDKSQLRTWATGEMGRATNLAWTPHYRHVELILNGDYVGVYQLAEQVRVAANRVNVDSLKPTDTTEPTIHGGYLMEINGRRVTEGAIGFATSKGVQIEVKDPDPPNAEQLAYLSQYVSEFESRLNSSAFTDPVAGYRPYLDVPAFIDHYWVQETVKNQDAFAYSTNIFKKRDGNLVFGPLWDFDNTMGNSRSLPVVHDPQGWESRTRMTWTKRLFLDPVLVAQADARWAELEPAFREVAHRVVAEGAGLQQAIADDAARWSYSPIDSDSPGFVSDWLLQRIDWIDAQVATP
jgi:hypothetical protein